MGLNLVPFSYLVHMGTPNVLPRARHSAQPTQRPTQWQMPGVRKAEAVTQEWNWQGWLIPAAEGISLTGSWI